MILKPKVVKHLDTMLQASFEYNKSGPCDNLYSSIEILLGELCELLDPELLKNIVEKVDGKNRDEWVSWFIEITVGIASNAISNFSQRVKDIEPHVMTYDKTKPPCSSGYNNINELVTCWNGSYYAYLSEKEKFIKSKKHQHKREGHTAPPYILKDIFSLEWKMGNR